MSTQGTVHASHLPPMPFSPMQTGVIDPLYLAGESAAIRRVRAQLERIAPYVRLALLTGEPGTGKERAARALHVHGPGADGPFVAWDAARLAERLMSTDEGPAVLTEAQGGMLLLSRLHTVPLRHQPVLLRLLQQHEARAHRAELRIVATSERDLRTLTTMGLFREDLYRRIAAVEITLPPLRRRQEDIVGLAEMILQRCGGEGLSSEAAARLVQHAWPGNVRELREVMERAMALAAGGVVEAKHLLLPEVPETAEAGLERLQDVIRRHVLEVLTRCSGNKLRASEVLGISRSTLYRMLDACAAGGDPGLPG